ncbi:uncharacterized protein LOC116805418 isoform X1 [Drosophila grimshawi]|uniref:uncharacterized protein LOC116805418 isoform X1 n=1 Tax=Drosophila grimshawi TaxID=7222 RepID=UPI000C870CD3|nr:uncharacterized protein LOC116805418 isoform X1 [Drosophila grimshawi]
MKLLGLCLLLLLAGACHAYPAEDKSLSLEDTDLDNEQGESVKESQIAKRSGSFDYVAHLKSGLLSSIGQASASIASGSSGGSSGGDSYKSHEVHVHGNSVEYDPWSFKKSVLNTIFQAVKAITGGVTALKGQLIKGSGYALSAGGNLVAAGGDKVTDVGKSIINSAHINSHTYATGHSSGSVTYVHPFAKLSSLSGASSSGSSGNKHSASAPGPALHTETITTYEIPTGHSNYGPPSKPPTYSSATHQYLPPAGSNYGGGGGGGGAPFSLNHAAFEAPQSNYLPSPYGQDAIRDDFSNNYGRHTKLSDDEARRAALQLQEILSMLPNGKTEYTASKTVALDTSNAPPTGSNVEQADLYNSYGVPLPHNLGTLESLSHTESITAAYAPPSQGAADIYHQMAKKPQTPEEAYIQKHPNEGYDYQPHPASGPAAPPAPTNEYRVENYHASKSNALKDLSPIIAALEVAKRKGPGSSNGPVTYAIEKQVHKTTPFQYLPPVVQKTKYVYSAPPPRNSYSGGYKVRRHVGAKRTSSTHSRAQDYEIQDPLMFNRLLYV